MRTARRIVAAGIWVGLGVMVCVGWAAGQAQGSVQGSAQSSAQSNVQGNAQESTQGNVQGKVVQEPGGVGIRKVIVVLRASGGGGDGEGAQEYSTATDATGQFVFEGVAAGQYVVSFARAGFVAVRMKAQDTIVTVVEGQDVTGLVYKMQAAGVIAGKIVDADGDPVANVSLWVTRSGKADAGREITAGVRPEGEMGQGTTNDLGEYRIANLRAGQYVVGARAAGNAEPSPNPADKGKQKERAVYAITFYPGTLDEKQASQVQVAPGGIATANFGMLTSGAYRVSGTVGGVGKAQMTEIILMSKGGTDEQQNLGEGGKFEFPSVRPGTYAVRVVQMNIGADGQTPSMKTYVIHEPIVVTSADVTGLALQVDLGGTVRGTFRVEGEEKVDWSELNVSLLPVMGEGEEAPVLEEMGMRPGQGLLKEDGSFEIKNVAGGNYQLAVGARGEKFRDYFTKSVMLNGQDVTDTGFVVSGDTEVEVLVSGKGASIEGTVVDGKGDAVAQATVVTMPSSGQLGRPDAYQSAIADERGHFLMRGMNPGEFTVVAVENLEGSFRRPEFFQKYGGSGTKVELEEGERKSVVVAVSSDQ
jgi:hypothetical protein